MRAFSGMWQFSESTKPHWIQIRSYWIQVLYLCVIGCWEERSTLKQIYHSVFLFLKDTNVRNECMVNFWLIKHLVINTKMLISLLKFNEVTVWQVFWPFMIPHSMWSLVQPAQFAVSFHLRQHHKQNGILNFSYKMMNLLKKKFGKRFTNEVGRFKLLDFHR